MSEERKKVEKKPLPKVESKIQPVEPPEEADKPLIKISDDKYIKIADDAKAEDFRALNERILKDELKWSHFAKNGEKSYHYYLIKK